LKAEDVRITELLEGPKQFIVPVFQRDYSWGTKHCLQLWKDILRVGSDNNAKAHFIGSLVYIAAEETSAKITRWLLIDGQQRLTTLTILLAALRNRIPEADEEGQQCIDEEALPTRLELGDYYLCNAHGKGDRRYKLHLRRGDHETLTALLDGKDLPADASERIRENFRFFENQLDNADLGLVYRGIKKLVAVDVALKRGEDDPQMIFESLNSTGLDLTQADLIRNFVLMRQDEELQTALYLEYWQPIEAAFGSRYRSDFDKFVRDHLTLQLRSSKPIKADEVYQHFRTYFYGNNGGLPVADVLADLKRFGNYYVAFSLGKEGNPKLREAFRRLRALVEVASPLILRLYECHERGKLSLDELVEAVDLAESYVFRRSVCAMQTRSLGQIFSSLAHRISSDTPLVSLKVAVYRLGKKRRFPSDVEFREALETRDVYDMRNCNYLLDRLENDSREKIDTSTFTIEHIMPQNENLCAEWQQMLGPEWKTVHETWLHRLGNLTLTAYNQEYSDRPFEEKKTIPKGFNESPLRLNKFVREQNSWNAAEIEVRGKGLAAKALALWGPLVVDIEAVKAIELEERKAQAARFSIDALEIDAESKLLFEQLRPELLALGEDVVELCGSKSVTYRVYDFFLEVIPRKRRLSLMLNLDYEECDDPTQRAEDATTWAFILNASEAGGVIYSLEAPAQIAAAMHIIRQAYEKVSA